MSASVVPSVAKPRDVRGLRPTSELSSAERSRLTDEIVAVVNNQALALMETRAVIEAHERRLAENVARLDAHAGILLRSEQRTLRSRLRWFFTGWLFFGGAK